MAENTQVPGRFSSITPSAARQALARLVEGSRRDGTPAQAADVVLVRQVAREWAAWYGSKGVDFERCPACWVASVRQIHGTDHYPYCDQHPGYVHLRAALDAASIAPEVCRHLDLPVPALPARPGDLSGSVGLRGDEDEPRRAFIRYDSDVEDALVKLLDPRERARLQHNLHDEVALLEEALLEWEHAHHRASDPCPCCGAVVRLDEQQRHLLGCEGHPAHAAARALERSLEEAVGQAVAADLLLVAGERNRFRDMLQALIYSCNIYENEMGWGDGAAYSKSWSERPWRDAREAAEALLKAAAETPAASARLTTSRGYTLVCVSVPWNRSSITSRRCWPSRNSTLKISWPRPPRRNAT